MKDIKILEQESAEEDIHKQIVQKQKKGVDETGISQVFQKPLPIDSVTSTYKDPQEILRQKLNQEPSNSIGSDGYEHL